MFEKLWVKIMFEVYLSINEESIVKVRPVFQKQTENMHTWAYTTCYSDSQFFTSKSFVRD